MNKNIQRSLLASLVLVAGLQQAVAADPVNINITGRVVASACVVNNNSGNLAVDLGSNIEASALATAGSGSTSIPFTLGLTACPSGTNSVTVTFTGTAAAAPQANMYVNTGAATPLAVELSSGSTILGNNSTLTQAVQSDKTVTYALNARAVTATGSVMPGSIIAVVQANFTYN